MQQAESQADTATVMNRFHNVTMPILTVVFIILVVIGGLALLNKAEKNQQDYIKEQDGVEKVINETLRQVAVLMTDGMDVNGDGYSNCIDAAVLFYKYYPYKKDVKIISNQNAVTNMNHMFNYVLINKSWRSVEPQAKIKNHKSYFMKDIWGDKYDMSKNMDVTFHYKKFAK